MHEKIKKIVYTAVFLALLVAFQGLTASFGSTLLTGSLVNLVLIASVLVSGFWSGAVVAIVSPFLAFLFGIGPQFPILLPVIALGNLILVAIWALFGVLFAKKETKLASTLRYVVSIAVAALCKCGFLYLGIVKLVLPVITGEMAAEKAAKVTKTLSASFGISQLFTALIGGAIAFAIIPTIRFALKRGKQ